MKKRKIITEKDGFKLVEGTVGVILDSIWHNEADQVLEINFATGKTLIHKPLDDDLTMIHKRPGVKSGSAPEPGNDKRASPPQTGGSF